MYEDLVKPILSQRCYTCHSTAKQKGKLRLDDKESLLKGGKHGVVLVANKVDESEIILRLLLPLDEKDNMPPKEKSQLTSTEIEILKLWIVSGADFEKTVTKLGQVEKLQSIVKIQVTPTPDVSFEPVAEANKETIQQLKKLEVTVLPVALNSNYLSVNLINTHKLDSALLILKDLKKQIIWLKAGNTSIKDDNLKSLSALTQLTKLNLDNSAFTGEGLLFLKSLSHLQSLNLANTQVTVSSLKPLTALKDLRILYLYQTQVKLSDLEFLKKSLPQVKIEIGGYQVPALPTDTLKVKAAIN